MFDNIYRTSKQLSCNRPLIVNSQLNQNFNIDKATKRQPLLCSHFLTLELPCHKVDLMNV